MIGYLIAGIALVTLAGVSLSVRILKQYERAAIFHLGRVRDGHDAAVRVSASEPESSGGRFARRVRRVRLYMYAFLAVALLVYVVALAGSNTHRVRVDWVFGSSSVALIWLVLLAAILGWLLGLAVAAVFRWRTRAPRPS